MGYEYGTLIDDHEVVVRYNMAPTNGFEKSVGTRTTYMWTWHAHYPAFKSKMNTSEYEKTVLMIGPSTVTELSVMLDIFQARDIHPDISRGR